MHRTIQPLARITKMYVVEFHCTPLMSGRTARRTSCAFAACVAARALLNVACLYCVAVCCAVFGVCGLCDGMHLACCYIPPLCFVFWSECGYRRYVCNSLLFGFALFCVVLFCVLFSVLCCIFAICSVVRGVDTLWACCSGLFRYVLLWYAAC